MAQVKLADNQYHDVADKDLYGSWYCNINNDGTLTLRGDSDTSKLPTNIPYGSVAITTTSDAYSFNPNGWEQM